MTKEPFTAKQYKYIEILADPAEKRDQKAIAKGLGVTRKTLYEWRKLEGFWEEVGKLVQDGTAQRMSRVWDKLMNQCERGNVQAMRLLFQLRGELVEKQSHEFESDGVELYVYSGRKDGEKQPPRP